MELFTVIEIGTETIKVLIGGIASGSENRESPKICIYGKGRAISNNLDESNLPIHIRKGEIINVDPIRAQIELAIHEAEADSGMDVRDTNLYVGIAGQFVRSENIEAAVSARDKHVTEDDLLRVQKIGYEKCVSEIDGTNEALQLCMRYFRTEQGITYDVINQLSRNLHAYMKAAICTNRPWYYTHKRMIQDATDGMDPIFLYTATVPTYARNDASERERHSLAIDIGAGLTLFSLNSKPGLIEFGHLPVGCNHIENDLMLGLEIDWEVAQHLVHMLDSIYAELNSEDGKRTVRLRHKGGQKEREVPMASIAAIVEARVEEIFELVKRELVARNVLDMIHGKVFISGGGALLPNVCQIASRVLELPAETARPGDEYQSTTGGDFLEDPRWIVPLGMLRMAITDNRIKRLLKDDKARGGSTMDLVKRIFRTMLNW